MKSLRPRIRLFAATTLVLLCAGCGSNGSDTHQRNETSSASCAAPYLNDHPPGGPFHGPVPTVRPGGTITIYGHGYTSTCNDTGGIREQLKPLPPVHLTLALPGGELHALGDFSPSGKDMGFSIVVNVPAAAPTGTATVRDDRESPATFEFEVGP
ncbi:hypothetical protein SAMN04487968_102336 [Nocardioides terrae]|uniref:IPT/TIG domain-containing protein n=1 Tax=Nocardioides terrae TaxID=574651 RepID=A0A1I1F237_9ACTN|nr:hypothetical protein [Nocardioides terrae]SFB93002.1 hypothetical protein SAMN04487968_102336 [Nocardioides terrae]